MNWYLIALRQAEIFVTHKSLIKSVRLDVVHNYYFSLRIPCTYKTSGHSIAM